MTPPTMMTAAAFLDWAMTRPEGERHELIDGRVISARPDTGPERRIRGDLATALRTALRLAGASGEIFVEQATLSVDAETVLSPDVMITHGGALGVGGVAASRPVIVADVMARLPRTVDSLARAVCYLRAPSIRHVLFADGPGRMLIWFARGADGGVAMRRVTEGFAQLDPLGMALNVGDCFVTERTDAAGD